jgi:hypothetical protein
MSNYLQYRMNHILAGRPLPKKAGVQAIAKKSPKRLAKEKEMVSDDSMNQFFADRRKELTGTCQCGCAEPSQKNDDMYFKFSICHIFPKARFESVADHPLNYVERSFWGGCHTNMDNRSMDLWAAMADFEDIKAKFFVLAPLLTPEERASKFFTKLEELVKTN